MVSPRKAVQSKLEASKASKLLEKYVFYLDIKNSADSKVIESKIKKFGGQVEVFLVESVTHIVADSPASAEGALAAAPPAPCSPRPVPGPNSPAPHTWGGRRRADAMLERAARLQPATTAPAPVAVGRNTPVWSVPKVKEFLSRLWTLAYRRLRTEERVLQEPFIKFEATDRKSRSVYKELGSWPSLRLRGEHGGCPFMSPGEPRAPRAKPPPSSLLPPSARKRMTRKVRPRPKEAAAMPLKLGGYCEICRQDYLSLTEHERSPAHINFVKNCSNFLALDSLISDSADVEAFLKMNKAGSLERRSLRNLSRGAHEPEGALEPRRQLEVICNGAEPHSPLSPGHYLRSKGPASEEKGSPLANGSASPPPPSPSPGLTGRHRAARWRPESRDTPYYRVVGMSTKLRSSSNFAPPPSRTACNGDGLVVKFRRVRRSELSVLSDEAENFMFPKKDSDSEEDEGQVKQEHERVVKLEDEEEAPAEEDRCLKWQEGRLRASAEVERLTYTFERVPHTEPWYDTFRRQDEGKENTKSIIHYLDHFSKSLILPYEMSELPPLKPNCCALSQVRRAGPPRPYGTRGMKRARRAKSEVGVPCLGGPNSRKSPREHASTLAILGGLTHKRSKFSCSEDSKSLPSIAEEDVSSDVPPSCNAAPTDASERLHSMFSTVYEEEEDFDVPMEAADCGLRLAGTSVKPDIIHLLQNYEECQTLENTVREIHENAQPEAPKKRRGYKFKKKNKTGWPNKKKPKRDAASACSSREPSEHTPHEERNGSVNSISWSEGEEEASSQGTLEGEAGGMWLQPVVRVQKMEARLERRLRSAGEGRRLRRRQHR